jgi:hypothetical protein
VDKSGDDGSYIVSAHSRGVRSRSPLIAQSSVVLPAPDTLIASPRAYLRQIQYHAYHRNDQVTSNVTSLYSLHSTLSRGMRDASSYDDSSRPLYPPSPARALHPPSPAEHLSSRSGVLGVLQRHRASLLGSPRECPARRYHSERPVCLCSALIKPDEHKSCDQPKSLRRFGSHAAQRSAVWEIDLQRNARYLPSRIWNSSLATPRVSSSLAMLGWSNPDGHMTVVGGVIDRIVRRGGPHRRNSLIGTRDMIASRAELLPP